MNRSNSLSRRLPVTVYIHPNILRNIEGIWSKSQKLRMKNKESKLYTSDYISKSSVPQIIIENNIEELKIDFLLELNKKRMDLEVGNERGPITVYILPEIMKSAEGISRKSKDMASNSDCSVLSVSRIFSLIVENHEEDIDYDRIVEMRKNE